MVAERTETLHPIYVSHLTFVNFLDWIREMKVTPTQVDRSLWESKFSGGTGSQLMAGLRFLGLLHGEAPTGQLEGLVHANAQDRKQLMQGILRRVYGTDFVNHLESSTPKMIHERLDEIGTTDGTSRKAFSFFVNAARAAELPMAPQIARQARNRKPRAKNTKAGSSSPSAHQPSGSQKTQPNSETPPAESQDVNTQTLELSGGGQVTLAVSLDLFNLSESDRTFALDLVDRVRAYKENGQMAKPNPADQEADGEKHVTVEPETV